MLVWIAADFQPDAFFHHFVLFHDFLFSFVFPKDFLKKNLVLYNGSNMSHVFKFSSFTVLGQPKDMYIQVSVYYYTKTTFGVDSRNSLHAA